MKRRSYLLKLIAAPLTVSFTGCAGQNHSSMSDSSVNEEMRIDEPPHEIKPPSDATGYDPKYLGTNMEIDSNIDFDLLTGIVPSQYGINTSEEDTDDAPDLSIEDTINNFFRIESVTNAEDFRATIDQGESDSQVIDDIDFGTDNIYIVRTGLHQESQEHRWVGGVLNDGHIQLHGYLFTPISTSKEYANEISFIRASNSVDVEYARASLTVAPSKRIHFNSMEGFISIKG